MTVFTPTTPTVSHFYKYKGIDHLEWLKPLILNHELYIPSVAQLNDPIDCRPKITPMSDEDMLKTLQCADTSWMLRKPSPKRPDKNRKQSPEDHCSTKVNEELMPPFTLADCKRSTREKFENKILCNPHPH